MYRNTKTTTKCIKLPNVGTLYPRFTEQGQILLNNYKLVTKGEKINNSQEISCSVVIFQHQIRFLHLLCVSVRFNQPKRYFISFTSILEVIYHTYLCIFCAFKHSAYVYCGFFEKYYRLLLSFGSWVRERLLLGKIVRSSSVWSLFFKKFSTNIRINFENTNITITRNLKLSQMLHIFYWFCSFFFLLKLWTMAMEQWKKTDEVPCFCVSMDIILLIGSKLC